MYWVGVGKIIIFLRVEARKLRDENKRPAREREIGAKTFRKGVGKLLVRDSEADNDLDV